MRIYHITTQPDWQAALQAGDYRADTLASQGFIHCSTREQILPVAQRYYPGRTGLLLLCIETDQVIAPIRYENLEGGMELFPHIYGALNLDAVVKVVSFLPGPGGIFSFPDELEP
jgi:uncharacterized protein (DUF952 family)